MTRKAQTQDWTPIPCDTIEQRLALFDAERDARDSEKATAEEVERVAVLVSERHDAALNKAVKVITRNPATRIQAYGVGGKPLPLGEAKPYDIPEHEDVAQAWDEVIESAKYWADQENYDAVETELARRLKNLLEAVKQAYDSATLDAVLDTLVEEGYKS